MAAGVSVGPPTDPRLGVAFVQAQSGDDTAYVKYIVSNNAAATSWPATIVTIKTLGEYDFNSVSYLALSMAFGQAQSGPGPMVVVQAAYKDDVWDELRMYRYRASSSLGDTAWGGGSAGSASFERNEAYPWSIDASGNPAADYFYAVSLRNTLYLTMCVSVYSCTYGYVSILGRGGVSTAIVRNRPAVALFYDVSSSQSGIAYVISSSTTGSEWVTVKMPLFNDDVAITAYHGTQLMTTPDDSPVILFTDQRGYDLYYRKADVDGSNINDWGDVRKMTFDVRAGWSAHIGADGVLGFAWAARYSYAVQYFDGGAPSASPSPTRTPSVSITRSPTRSTTSTATGARSVTPSKSPSLPPTRSPSLSATASDSRSPSLTGTPTPTISVTPSRSVTRSPTRTRTATPSVTPTRSVTPSVTPTISVTPSVTPTISVTSSVTPTISVTSSVTPSPSVSTSASRTQQPSELPDWPLNVAASSCRQMSSFVALPDGRLAVVCLSTPYAFGDLSLWTSPTATGLGGSWTRRSLTAYASVPSVAVVDGNVALAFTYSPPGIGGKNLRYAVVSETSVEQFDKGSMGGLATSLLPTAMLTQPALSGAGTDVVVSYCSQPNTNEIDIYVALVATPASAPWGTVLLVTVSADARGVHTLVDRGARAPLAVVMSGAALLVYEGVTPLSWAYVGELLTGAQPLLGMAVTTHEDVLFAIVARASSSYAFDYNFTSNVNTAFSTTGYIGAPPFAIAVDQGVPVVVASTTANSGEASVTCVGRVQCPRCAGSFCIRPYRFACTCPRAWQGVPRLARGLWHVELGCVAQRIVGAGVLFLRGGHHPDADSRRVGGWVQSGLSVVFVVQGHDPPVAVRRRVFCGCGGRCVGAARAVGRGGRGGDVLVLHETQERGRGV